MIRCTCSNCQSTLEAKEKLAGQTRKCPKCGADIHIPELKPEPSPEPITSEFEGPDELAGSTVKIEASQEGLPRFEGPARLVRGHRYVVCDRASVFAVWADGSGWMLKTNTGMVSAPRNPEMLPSEGSFVLVELLLDRDHEGIHLTGVQCHKLATRYALLALEHEEDKILTKVVGYGSLNRDQKLAVFRLIKEIFMPDVWENAHDVREFLTNSDYTSAGTVHPEHHSGPSL